VRNHQRIVLRANVMNCGGTFAIDPFSIGSKQCSHAAEFQPAMRANARFRHTDRIHTLDGVEANVRAWQSRGAS